MRQGITTEDILPALASASTTSMAANSASAVSAGVVAAALKAVEDPEAAAENEATNHVAGNSQTKENATATVVALDLSKLPMCNTKSVNHCHLGIKCNVRHVDDEKANTATSSTAESSGASADQDSDVGDGDSEDDE